MADFRSGIRPKDHAAEDKRITVCTDCKRGIFKGHSYKWTNRGLVHLKCKVEGGFSEAKVIKRAL